MPPRPRHRLGRGPVTALFRKDTPRWSLRHRQQMAGEQLSDAPPDGARSRDAVVTKVAGDCTSIEFAGESWECAESLQLGPEREERADPTVIERLLSEAVAHEMEFAALPVPQGRS